MKEKTYNVFVYGSLLKGMRNHHSIMNEKFVGNATIKGTMYSYVAYPAVRLEGNNIIEGEVYNVSEKTLEKLDSIEGFHEKLGIDSPSNFYRRVEIFVDMEGIKTRAYIYEINRSEKEMSSYKIVEEPNWANYYTRTHKPITSKFYSF